MAASVYEFGRGKNTSYDIETFLRVLTEMSAEDKTARTACLLDDDSTECENLKPAGDTFRYYPNVLDPVDLIEMHDKVSELLIGQIKRFVKFEHPVKAEIDPTEVEIPGDPEKTDDAVEEIGGAFRELDDGAVGQFVHGVQDEESDAKYYKFTR